MGFQITEVDHKNVTVKEYRVNHKVKDVTDVPGLLGEENYNEAMEVIAFKWGDLGDAALQKYKVRHTKVAKKGMSSEENSGKQTKVLALRVDDCREDKEES